MGSTGNSTAASQSMIRKTTPPFRSIPSTLLRLFSNYTSFTASNTRLQALSPLATPPNTSWMTTDKHHFIGRRIRFSMSLPKSRRPHAATAATMLGRLTPRFFAHYYVQGNFISFCPILFRRFRYRIRLSGQVSRGRYFISLGYFGFGLATRLFAVSPCRAFIGDGRGVTASMPSFSSKQRRSRAISPSLRPAHVPFYRDADFEMSRRNCIFTRL